MAAVGTFELILIWIAVWGVASGAVYQARGGTFGGGFWWGALLGFIGLVIVVVKAPGGRSENATRQCPHCRSMIRRDASVCPRCARDVEAWSYAVGRWWVTRPDGSYWFDEKRKTWMKG